MPKKIYFCASATIFLLVFLAHLSRLIYGWPIQIDGWLVPVWLSWIGVIVAGYLSWNGYRLLKK